MTEFLDAYIAGELPLFRRQGFDAHLAMCLNCRNYLDGYRKTIALSRDAMRADGPSPAEMPEELVAAILKARRA